ncbi:MAG: diguanylate cyclase, partial [Phycisphaerae bacterium]|nr:diguanylate cyclase [Phycisphaerae bacterium]
LREASTTEYVPVIVMAATVDEDHRCMYLDSGADDVIGEETSGDEMLARISSLLRIKGLHNQLAASRAALQQALRRERRLLEKLRRDNAHLQTLATTDPLTHAQNTRSFHDIMEHEFKAAKRYDYSLSLLMIDVDHFKVVNDTHGHPSGDYILKEMTVILKRSVRESDVVSRTGGEEFTVLLPQADRGQANTFAERIRKEVAAREFIVYGATIQVTISVGVATYPEDPEITDSQMLLYFADQALLSAKETGRDRVVAISDLEAATRQRLHRQYMEIPHDDAITVATEDGVPEVAGQEGESEESLHVPVADFPQPSSEGD